MGCSNGWTNIAKTCRGLKSLKIQTRVAADAQTDATKYSRTTAARRRRGARQIPQVAYAHSPLLEPLTDDRCELTEPIDDLPQLAPIGPFYPTRNSSIPYLITLPVNLPCVSGKSSTNSLTIATDSLVQTSANSTNGKTTVFRSSAAISEFPFEKRLSRDRLERGLHRRRCKSEVVGRELARVAIQRQLRSGTTVVPQ